VAKEGNCPC